MAEERFKLLEEQLDFAKNSLSDKDGLITQLKKELQSTAEKMQEITTLNEKQTRDLESKDRHIKQVELELAEHNEIVLDLKQRNERLTRDFNQMELHTSQIDEMNGVIGNQLQNIWKIKRDLEARLKYQINVCYEQVAVINNNDESYKELCSDIKRLEARVEEATTGNSKLFSDLETS